MEGTDRMKHCEYKRTVEGSEGAILFWTRRKAGNDS